MTSRVPGVMSGGGVKATLEVDGLGRGRSVSLVSELARLREWRILFYLIFCQKNWQSMGSYRLITKHEIVGDRI